MKVYLAGKMTETDGAWRDGVLGTVYDYEHRRRLPRWEIVRKIPDSYQDEDVSLEANRWPQGENTHVLGLHDYVGPYRMTCSPEPQSKHCGYFHGSTGRGQHGWLDDEERTIIVRECFAAIRRADFVFAYLNSPDCYGTVGEIGYALAIGKYVHLVVSEDACWGENDYWLIEQLAAGADFDSKWDRTEGESEQDRVRRFFEGALVRWTGRSEKPAPVALVARDSTEPYIRALQEAANAFAQIGRWSADPRVRDEARRMLKRIAG